ncbi:SLAM family member 7 isoform X1 [Ictalurus punctatus]|uniref:SLAM family member 7 isoform X1 n=1 Tax=Ictalurus punctatus TaxID=7998 RepID=A0A2D0SAK1_ICTPU|nr:SLAM family member 7 isoform X1 [Ictalurus punctatus]XP_017339753.1 SLAM family member 7 isoform X1 [Ictalurus punctatus]XP_017339754.1 SLAM family member 7 isoform X1 [Ictalurus punctatus]XP_017339755.1 SLAM family member 7 isoform X1 [Ictalurus punctatus]XP_047015141.1 SLAM family member 7 isoform X1 [Ictalurus punctatus]XP_053540802.1 SLAM family member 7 isoform X1 [Ictalurus punctatus]XP_053540803.1 SLAM family member 7 isoform X1 [Ictalurus punctatus]
MNTKGSVIVLFLCFLTLFTLTDCSTCQKNILEGGSLTFKLTDRPLNDNDRFTIKKDNKVVVLKKNNKQEGPGIVKKDSLELLHVKLSDSGTYGVDVFDVTGINVKSYSEIVCVYAKVPKPRVNITCQDEKVDFRCDVEVDKDQRSAISYSWHKNGKEFKKNVFNFSINAEEDKSEYTCTAQNPVHKSTSDPVEAACFKHTLFGFDFWFMVGLLAGGGGLVLLLIIVLVTLACRSCRRKDKQQRDEEELRLNYVNASQSSGQQKSKHTARGQPAPPEPYDDVSAQEVPCQAEPKPRSQQRGRPPPPPIDDEEEHPPPLPQPRKKAQVKKREAPL